MRIGITGSAGMLGWHLRCYLAQFDDVDVVLADRRTFQDAQLLENFVASVDSIAHFAGMNRGEGEELVAANVGIAESLVAALEKRGATPHVVYSSTTHIERDSPYGQSKKRAGEIIGDWAARNEARFCNMVLPHVFGEGTKPFYNSAVATFAYQLATGGTPEIHTDADLELVHAQDVAAAVLQVIRGGDVGQKRLAGDVISVSDVLQRLIGIAESYQDGVIPDLGDRLSLLLFNLYRSYLFPTYYPRSLDLHSDDRGNLVEIVKNLTGGQVFFSTTRPGITRGNHFHYHKVERFLVVDGQARIRVRRLFDDECHEFDVCGSKPAFIDMPPLHTHSITNTGTGPLLTLFWANEIFDPDAPDTVAEPV